MKKILRLVVFLMCMTWLLSLFGCGKGLRVDGPDMERNIWSAFTLSRCSETFEPVYSYTVKYDNTTNEAFLWETKTMEKRVALTMETLEALFRLELMSLPDAESQDGVFLGLAVTDSNGRVYSKQISSKKEKEILVLLAPYLDELKEEEPFMLDGPDMEYQSPWRAFSLSRTDSNARYSFWFSVTEGESDALVSGGCRDKDGLYYESNAGIPISAEDLWKLRWMELGQLPDEEPWPEDLEQPLDMASISLTLTLSDGTLEKKTVSGDLSMEIYEILAPYLKNQQE